MKKTIYNLMSCRFLNADDAMCVDSTEDRDEAFQWLTEAIIEEHNEAEAENRLIKYMYWLSVEVIDEDEDKNPPDTYASLGLDERDFL